MGFYRGPHIVTDGLVLALDAANTKSYPGTGTTWSNLATTSNNGTLTNGPTFSSANGGSIVFDGSNDYTSLPSNFFAYPSLTTFTINLWFKSNQSTGGTIFGQENTITPGLGTGYVPVIYLRSDGLIRVEPFWTGNLNNNILSTAALNDNVWHNITTTFSSGTNQLYVNGVFITQRTGLTLTAYAATYYYFIGAGSAGGRSLGTNYYNGNISNFLFYNRALTAAEVLQNYNATKSRFNL